MRCEHNLQAEEILILIRGPSISRCSELVTTNDPNFRFFPYLSDVNRWSQANWMRNIVLSRLCKNSIR
jgi:hypothetical protein